MKRILTLIILAAGLSPAAAQVDVGLTAGANLSNIVETNNLPNWNSIKSNYAYRLGFHAGLYTAIPLNRKGTLVLEPQLVYFNKGRKYFQQFDSSANVLAKDSSFKQQLNYIDIPFNLLLKLPIGAKLKLILGGGPYISFFFNGSEQSVTNYKDPSSYPSVTVSNTDLPVGKAPGKYMTMDYGATVVAGFELEKVFLRASASQSLSDMYQARNYTGTFRNRVFSVSLGVKLATIILPDDKPKRADSTGRKTGREKKIKDRDGDGVPDNVDQCPKVPGSKEAFGCPDRDGDGIPDKDDRCPDVRGVAANQGCPAVDTDGDGIPDAEDKCPTVKGSSKYQGCPIPDTDGDGINDEEDRCPLVPGLLRYHGCPIPDTDGDGVNDEIDQCPNEPGPASNHGCPEKKLTTAVIEKIKTVTHKIQFEYNKAILLPSSNAALDEVVGILNSDPTVKLTIEGHASMEGRPAVNQTLSENRAVAVRNYLVAKGVDAARLTTIGYGSAKLLTTVVAEQAINRRVELILSY